jgi:hypothetical protein
VRETIAEVLLISSYCYFLRLRYMTRRTVSS